MSVEVLLMSDVSKLGNAGQIVHVAPGYARNSLIPKGLAAPVTEASRRRLAKLQAERAKKAAEEKAAAQATAQKLANLSITVNAHTVDGTHLYGSVGATDILAAIEADRGVKLERRQLDMPDTLKEVGTFDVALKLGHGVRVPFKIQIVAEDGAPAAE